MATLPHAAASRELAHYRSVGELAYSREQGARAWELIHQHPTTFLNHALRRVWFFWVSVPHPNAPTFQGIALETAREFSYALISLSGLLGLALAIRRRVPSVWLFLWAVLTVPLLYYAVTVQARFRHPLEPILCVFAVYLFRSAEPIRSADTSPARA
jgi:hypothetical protein